MKIMKLKYEFLIFLLLIIGAGFVACEKDIEFKGKIGNPKPVLNGLLTPDSVVTVQLTQTRFVLSPSDSFEAISDAQVSLYVNGVLKEQLTHFGNGKYKGTYYPQPGDDIKIEASGNGFENLFAQTVIPMNSGIVVADSIVTINKEEAPYDDNRVLKTETRNLQFKLILTDAAGEDNYYYIKGKRSTRINRTGQIIDFPIDIKLNESLKNSTTDTEDFFDEIFGDDYDSGDIDNLFSDRFVDGKEIVFDFSFHDIIDSYALAEGEEIDYDNRAKFTVKYEIEIGEISKDFYHCMISADKAVNAEDFGPFAEPMMIYSNIQNGVGILGSYNTYRFTSEFESYTMSGFWG